MAKSKKADPRSFAADHMAWCRNTMAILADRGSWGVPRSGLVFQRRGDGLVLVTRQPHHQYLPMSQSRWEAYQQDDYETIKRHFEAAGYTMADETRQ